MKRALFLSFVLAAGPAAAQTPSPEQKPAAQPAPRPALKLRLDELDPEPARYAPREPVKKDAVQSLPGLGGRPHETWEQRKSEPIPKNTAGDSPVK